MTKKFPKENEDRLRETIKKLKSERRNLLKTIKFLQLELEMRQTKNKTKVKKEKMTNEEFKKDFAKRFKEGLNSE